MNHEGNAMAKRRGGGRRWPRPHWIALGLVGAVLLFFVLGHLVVWLWAQTVADLFGWKEITFWQAWGLILLSQILLKANVSSGGSSRSRSRRRKGSRRGSRESRDEWCDDEPDEGLESTPA